MAEIIAIAMKGAAKTQIMYKANLSFGQVKWYLAFLLEHGLLEKSVQGGRVIYKSTARGMAFMERQQRVVDLLNEDQHGTSVV